MATFLTSTARLKFTVRRLAAKLVLPAAPTPRKLKRLSDIDDQQGLRFRAPTIHFCRRNASCKGRDPAAVIRDSVAKALVYYYPLAGRLRELQGGKLAVDCTAEGVLFAEADTDVRLEDFGDSVHPPLPCLEELFFDDPTATSSILDSPLVQIQVTRLACGGFTLAVQMSHTLADGQGIMQFLEAVAEFARGAAVPTVHPVWARDLLLARILPRPSFAHREYDEVLLDPKDTIALPADNLVQGFVFFGPQDVAAIKAQLAPDLRDRSTTFDVLTAFLWKCRTMALQLPDADEEVRLGFAVSATRGKRGLSLPKGYYGNTIVVPVAISPASELCANPVDYAVKLVHKAKREVDAEYIQSVADLMLLRGRPMFALSRLYLVSDVTKIDLARPDYGWGQAVYGGPATIGPSPIPGMSSFIIPCKNAKGENGVVVPMCLPARAMDRFREEVRKLMIRSSL